MRSWYRSPYSSLCEEHCVTITNLPSVSSVRPSSSMRDLRVCVFTIGVGIADLKLNRGLHCRFVNE